RRLAAQRALIGPGQPVPNKLVINRATEAHEHRAQITMMFGEKRLDHLHALGLVAAVACYLAQDSLHLRRRALADGSLATTGWRPRHDHDDGRLGRLVTGPLIDPVLRRRTEFLLLATHPSDGKLPVRPVGSVELISAPLPAQGVRRERTQRLYRQRRVG